MNIFDLPDHVLEDELVNILLEKKNIRIERIVSTGQTTHWYDQSEDEFIMLLDGYAKIELENNKIVELKKGDTLLLKSHEKHRVCYTSTNPPCIWICIFFQSR